MEETIYQAIQVRLICQQIYGRPISAQLFTEWRKRMDVMPNVQHLSEDEAFRLIVYADMRREYGYFCPGKGRRAIDLRAVKHEALTRRADKEWLKRMKEFLTQTKNQKLIWTIAPTEGRFIPQLIKQRFGYQVNERTIRRLFKSWNKAFHRQQLYDPSVLECVLMHFEKKFQKRVVYKVA